MFFIMFFWAFRLMLIKRKAYFLSLLLSFFYSKFQPLNYKDLPKNFKKFYIVNIFVTLEPLVDSASRIDVHLGAALLVLVGDFLCLPLGYELPQVV